LVTAQRRPERPVRPVACSLPPRREIPLVALHDLLWDWTRELDPGQTAEFASPDGSVLHAERRAGAIRLTVVGGHRKVVFRWDARAGVPHLVAPGGISPSIEEPYAWEAGGEPVLELRAGGALFRFPIPAA
jgi:hypothetical protein